VIISGPPARLDKSPSSSPKEYSRHARENKLRERTSLIRPH
jgi:hypothetical protein